MKYLRLIPALLLGAMLTACNPTKRLYEAQQYDQVIQRVAPEVCKGKLNAKDVNYVAASYHKANQADHERIQSLKATGQPDVWPEIYQRYCSMKGRNEALKCFPKKVKQGMNYVPLDLDDDILAARNKAESFLVAKAGQLLNSGSRVDAMEAEKYVEQLWRTNPENSKLLDLRKKCALYTNEHIELGFVSSINYSPLDIKSVLFAFDEGELPSQISNVRIVSDPRPGENRKAMVCVIEENVTVSPTRLDEVTFKETKGNQTVEVTDYSQSKTMTVAGYIQYRSKHDGKILGFVPFEVTSTFKNDYTTIKGDREACSVETLNRLNTKPLPIPTDASMHLDVAKEVHGLLVKELRK